MTEKNKTAERKQRLRKFKPREMVTMQQYKETIRQRLSHMVSEVHECLANLSDRFPAYKDQGYEIEGFVWFQGWNDQYQDRWLTYEKNMANLIRDVRKEIQGSEYVNRDRTNGTRWDEAGQTRFATRLH